MSRARFRRCAARAIYAFAGLALDPSAFADEGAAPEGSNWLSTALTYDGTVLADLRGGVQTGTTYVGNLHLKLTGKGETIGLPGTSAYADVLTIHGGHPSILVGDAQGVSNLEGPTGTQVEELWVQHNFKGSSASLLVGIYDLNSEFYRLQAAGLFLNGAFGVGPEFAHSGVEGPSIFPRTSAGFRFAFKPTSNTVLRMVVLDGVPVVRADGSRAAFHSGDGLVTVAEFAMLSRVGTGSNRQPNMRDRIGRFSSLAPYDDKLALGVWHYTCAFPDLSDTEPSGKPRLRSGSSGAYSVGEHLLMGDRSQGQGKHLAAFVQAGIADARINRFGSYVGAGIVGAGWPSMKESDQFGVSVARAGNGSHYGRAQAARGVAPAETTIELSYLTQVSKYLTVQPDLQYVSHPDTDLSIPSAWVLQLRFAIEF